MKICLTSESNSLESQLDQRFGRAPYFIILDTETMNYEVIENTALRIKSGAGVSSAQTVADKNIAAVITGNIGPKAMAVLEAANIKIYKGAAASVKENTEKFHRGLLEKIDSPAPAHFGMRGK